MGFGLVSCTSIIILVTPILFVYISNSLGYENVFLVVAGIIFIGLLFLLPVNKLLFNQSPRIRKVDADSKASYEPIVTLLLVLIVPFYFVYWSVRTHKFIRNYSQSTSLLTPCAAGWGSLLVPFALPIMLVNLYDVADDICSLAKRSRWKFILLSVFLPPIAVAIVQDRLNQLNYIETNGELS